MSLSRMVILIGLAILPAVAAAAPPQPPLTNATIAEFRERQRELWSLQDNAFLFEEGVQDYGRQLVAWKDAPVLLQLQVSKVTKEGVVCESPLPHCITVRNRNDAVLPGHDENGAVVLRIDDVVPQSVARRLRAGDQLVLRGVVASSKAQPGGAAEFAIGEGKPVAVVARVSEFESQRLNRAAIGRIERAQMGLTTPLYPSAALDEGATGQAVFNVLDRNVVLAQSAGHASLDEGAKQALERLRNNLHLFQGEHRFQFDILAR